MAHPLSIRFPISADAVSDCLRLRRSSAVSKIGAKTGELGVSDISVRGVEERDRPLLFELLDISAVVAAWGVGWEAPEGAAILGVDGEASQLAQKWV